MWFEHYLQKKLNQVCMVCIASLSLTPDCAHTSTVALNMGKKADFSKKKMVVNKWPFQV